MENKCLAGIHKKTGVVEIIASLKSHVEEHLKDDMVVFLRGNIQHLT